ncbi:site-2 protease family protein [Saccharibacillus sacchari]|uniref:Site-2 protease family protein n=1 Tax=Saccharibacillus sacchari TaxID=456493 RepID=A0ACC6P995_9BACL
MKINENFVVETMGDNRYFFSNRENGKGYYITGRLELDEAMLLKKQPPSLVKIGYLVPADHQVRDRNRINDILNFKQETNAGKLLGWMVAGIILSFFSIIFLSLNHKEIFATELNTMSGIQGAILFFIGILFVHEVFHIIAARMQQIEVIKVGFRLKYYFFPIAYVRILATGHNLKRANVALAGNLADVLLANAYMLLFLNFQEPIYAIAFSLQLTMLFFNYNLLLPTDFTIFLLSLIKKPDFRANAIAYTKFKLKVSKKIKESLLQAGRGVRFAYLAYGLVFYGFLATLMVTFAINIYHILRG